MPLAVGGSLGVVLIYLFLARHFLWMLLRVTQNLGILDPCSPLLSDTHRAADKSHSHFLLNPRRRDFSPMATKREVEIQTCKDTAEEDRNNHAPK